MSDEDGIRQGDGDYLASLPLMKPFNFDASNLGAAVANERAKRDEDTERRLSMCVLPARRTAYLVFLKQGARTLHSPAGRESCRGAARCCGASGKRRMMARCGVFAISNGKSASHLHCLNREGGLQLFVRGHVNCGDEESGKTEAEAVTA